MKCTKLSLSCPIRAEHHSWSTQDVPPVHYQWQSAPVRHNTQGWTATFRLGLKLGLVWTWTHNWTLLLALLYMTMGASTQHIAMPSRSSTSTTKTWTCQQHPTSDQFKHTRCCPRSTALAHSSTPSTGETSRILSRIPLHLWLEKALALCSVVALDSNLDFYPLLSLASSKYCWYSPSPWIWCLIAVDSNLPFVTSQHQLLFPL